MPQVSAFGGGECPTPWHPDNSPAIGHGGERAGWVVQKAFPGIDLAGKHSVKGVNRPGAGDTPKAVPSDTDSRLKIFKNNVSKGVIFRHNF